MPYDAIDHTFIVKIVYAPLFLLHGAYVCIIETTYFYLSQIISIIDKESTIFQILTFFKNFIKQLLSIYNLYIIRYNILKIFYF